MNMMGGNLTFGSSMPSNTLQGGAQFTFALALPTMNIRSKKLLAMFGTCLNCSMEFHLFWIVFFGFFPWFFGQAVFC